MNRDLPFSQPEIDQIIQTFFPNKGGRETLPPSVELDNSECTQEDRDACASAASGKNGELFQQLFSGDISAYPSHSEADLALCNMIAPRVAYDSKAIDRIYRQSSLYRTKWDEKHGKFTYGQMTIATTIKGKAGTPSMQYTSAPKNKFSFVHIGDVIRNVKPTDWPIKPFLEWRYCLGLQEPTSPFWRFLGHCQ